MTKKHKNIWNINMAEESLQFRLRKIDEARKYIFEEIKHDLIS